MKLIIDMPEKVIEAIKVIAANQNEEDYRYDIYTAIAQGTPLPKGHGRLIDISKIDEDRIESDNPIIYLTINGEYIEAVSLDYLNNLPTIIEADEETENETN